jgi:hypothetical protein
VIVLGERDEGESPYAQSDRYIDTRRVVLLDEKGY